MIKEFIKAFIPDTLMQRRRRLIAKRNQAAFAQVSVSDTFSQIYEKNIWGGKNGEFFSGRGSAEKYSVEYADAIETFIEENNIRRVIDLGCGDFRVASKFVSEKIHYIGCDVVPSLIAYLNDSFANNKTEFRLLNIIEDEMPEGDLCLIRQVLQHLSNDEIAKVFRNASKFKFLIITESYPHPDRNLIPNLDIPHGPDMRLHFDSAVCLNEPPFNFKNVSLLLDLEAEEGTRIKTFVIRQENL